MKVRFLALAATLIAACGPASALIYQGSLSSGASTAADYSGTGLLSFDVDFADHAPLTLNYTVEAGDLLAPIDFNAILRNFTGIGQSWISLTLSGGAFDDVGTVTRSFGGGASAGGSGAYALLAFSTPEFLDVQVGDPLGGNAAARDWSIDLSGLQAGGSFSITAASVPEPSTYALMLGAVGLLGWTTARRQKKG